MWLKATVLPRRLSDVIYQELKTMIFQGVLPPGSPLKEDQLARQFGVSNTPVRAALSQLARDGLVTVRPHSQTIIRILDPLEISHIFDVRTALEVLAIETACDNVTDADIESLQKLQMEGEAAAEGEDISKYHAYNSRWHQTILRIANNTCLSRVSAAVSDEVRFSIGTTFGTIGIPTDNVNQHAMMIDALARRDKERAAALMRSHIQLAKRQLLESINSGG